jgi:hypothetical protein
MHPEVGSAVSGGERILRLWLRAGDAPYTLTRSIFTALQPCDTIFTSVESHGGCLRGVQCVAKRSSYSTIPLS